MKYFIIEQDKQFSDAPDLINWYDEIDVRNICWGRSYQLPERALLMVRPSLTLVFAELLTQPFLLCSSMVRETIDLYERDVPYKQIVLMDQENQQAEVYYLPILETVDCLSAESKLNLDRSVIHEAVLEQKKMPDNSIFWLDNLNRRYTVIRLDLLESLLRRGLKYISLQEVRVAG